jgi:glycosyltransferase involved in cell wall biosynthesis
VISAAREPRAREDPVVAIGPAMPRILVLSESLPFPTLKGGDLRTWQHINGLAAFADVGVFGLCSNDPRRHTLPELSLACWTASTDPALTYPPPSGRNLKARAWLLEPTGHPSDLYFSAAAAQELAELLARFRPDVVLVEGLWLQGYLATVRAAGCRTILDCFNVEAAVSRQLASTRSGDDLEARVIRDILPARTETIERRAIEAADQVWVCSVEDAQRLRELYAPRAPVVVIPNALRLDAHAAGAVHRRRASPDPLPLTVVFPGMFSYLPNSIAAAFLIDEIFPRLTALCADCRLILVGPMPLPAMLAAAERDTRIVVTGLVADVRPHLAQATVMAVPLFQGGGTHLKVLEAFAAGVPVVSTRKGAEGLGAQPATHLLLAETADEFADAILALWRDPAMVARMTGQARALVAERFSWASVESPLRAAIAALVTDA